MKSVLELFPGKWFLSVLTVSRQIISASFCSPYFAATRTKSVGVLVYLRVVVLSLSVKIGRGSLYTVCAVKD